MIDVNKESFNQEVLESEKPVIVDFWGPNCGPCKKLMPDVEELSEIHRDRVKFVKLNTVENRRLCINYRVMGLPAFLVFNNGREVKRISGGELSKEDVETLIVENTQ
jgi:thioredoxin 1